MPERAAKLLARARWVLLWERLWPLLLPPVSVLMVFAALALFDVLPALPAWLHGAVLLVLAALFLILLARLRHLRWPDLRDAMRRVERDSGLPHHPLQALADLPAGAPDDPQTQALWRLHRHRLEETAAQFRLNWPSPGMAARDPLGWRFAALLLLIIALAGGGKDISGRLARAADPVSGMPALAPPLVELWLTPPAYTGMAPQRLGPPGAQPVVVPASSSLLALVSGGWGTAVLTVDGVRTRFQPVGENSQRLETILSGGSILDIGQGWRTLGRWPVELLRDAVPAIAFAAPPDEAPSGRLRMKLTASDDYGVAAARLELRRIGSPLSDAPHVLPLSVPGKAPRQLSLEGWFDLTGHPWAGLPVLATPVARDAIGQEGSGEPVTITLPERIFSHPVAFLLAAMRRDLIDAPETAPQAAAVLGTILEEPAAFGGDLRIVLALHVARLSLARGLSRRDEVLDLLWNAALRIEDGTLSETQQVMEAARQRLERALADKAPEAEIEQLLAEYQEAVKAYLNALIERMDAIGAPRPFGTDVLTEDALNAMLKQLQTMAEVGAHEAARQMLDSISSLVDRVQGGRPPADIAKISATIEALRALARDQQELLDRTRQPTSPLAPLAPEQDRLKERLTRLSRDMAQQRLTVGKGIEDAASLMDHAARMLSAKNRADAVSAQSEAARLLAEAARNAMERAAGAGNLGDTPQDPLGRPLNTSRDAQGGSSEGGKVQFIIPEQGEIGRAHTILEELRRRFGDWQRPEAERDYLRRLLQQY